VVDFHCEASSEKQGIGFSATAAPASWSAPTPMCRLPTIRFFPVAPAYMTDAGMTGDYDSIIGMQKGRAAAALYDGHSLGRFEPALGTATLSGVAVETDDETGLALRMRPVRIGGRLEPTLPGFWESGRGHHERVARRGLRHH